MVFERGGCRVALAQSRHLEIVATLHEVEVGDGVEAAGGEMTLFALGAGSSRERGRMHDRVTGAEAQRDAALWGDATDLGADRSEAVELDGAILEVGARRGLLREFAGLGHMLPVAGVGADGQQKAAEKAGEKVEETKSGAEFTDCHWAAPPR